MTGKELLSTKLSISAIYLLSKLSNDFALYSLELDF